MLQSLYSTVAEYFERSFTITFFYESMFYVKIVTHIPEVHFAMYIKFKGIMMGIITVTGTSCRFPRKFVIQFKTCLWKTHTHTHGRQHSMRVFSGQGKPLMHTNVSKSEDERWGQVNGVRCVSANMHLFLALQPTGWICQWHVVHSSFCQLAVTQLALISEGWVTRMCNIVPVDC